MLSHAGVLFVACMRVIVLCTGGMLCCIYAGVVFVCRCVGVSYTCEFGFHMHMVFCFVCMRSFCFVCWVVFCVVCAGIVLFRRHVCVCCVCMLVVSRHWIFVFRMNVVVFVFVGRYVFRVY